MLLVEASMVVIDALDCVLPCEGGVAMLGIGDCEGKIADLGLPVPVGPGPDDGDDEPILVKGLRRCDMVGAFDVIFRD